MRDAAVLLLLCCCCAAAVLLLYSVSPTWPAWQRGLMLYSISVRGVAVPVEREGQRLCPSIGKFREVLAPVSEAIVGSQSVI
jgi:hypothetical protein